MLIRCIYFKWNYILIDSEPFIGECTHSVTLKRRPCRLQTADRADCADRADRADRADGVLFSCLNKSTNNPDIEMIDSLDSPPSRVQFLFIFLSDSHQLSVCFSYGVPSPSKFMVCIWRSHVNFTFKLKFLYWYLVLYASSRFQHA